MESIGSTAQSIANGCALGSRIESADDVNCKLLANGGMSEADCLDTKEDVKQFLDDARSSNLLCDADDEGEESNGAEAADAEMTDDDNEPSGNYTGCDRVEPLRLTDSFWKLDRRASGHLFWRRDSSTLQDGVDPSSRVKFRYDVTVREYAEQQQDSEHEDDTAEEDDLDERDGFVPKQQKDLKTDESGNTWSGWATSPAAIYSAVFLAMMVAAAIHWYLWGRTAWAKFVGGRRESSV